MPHCFDTARTVGATRRSPAEPAILKKQNTSRTLGRRMPQKRRSIVWSVKLGGCSCCGRAAKGVSKPDFAPWRPAGAEGVSKPDFAPWRGARQIAGGERSEPPELENGEQSPGRGETILSYAPQGSFLFASIPGARKNARPRLIVLRPAGATSLNCGFTAISAARPYEIANGRVTTPAVPGRLISTIPSCHKPASGPSSSLDSTCLPSSSSESCPLWIANKPV